MRARTGITPQPYDTAGARDATASAASGGRLMTSDSRSSLVSAPNGRSYLAPFILVTSLFFLWGLAHSLLDVLNKHFQEILGVTKAQSGLVQTAVYGGYFIMAIPAGMLMKKALKGELPLLAAAKALQDEIMSPSMIVIAMVRIRVP